jgi:hypothetical protein
VVKGARKEFPDTLLSGYRNTEAEGLLPTNLLALLLFDHESRGAAALSAYL